nr:MAG: nucleolar RNA-binding protein, Nop10p family [Candidatus Nanosalinarum sp. J07AB56]
MIRKNPDTGQYTVKDAVDGTETVSTHPPKFSYPDDMAEYRRRTREDTE